MARKRARSLQRWTLEEEQYLADHFQERTLEWIAKHMKRTKGGIQRKAYEMKLRKAKRITPEMKEKILLLYNTMPTTALAEKFNTTPVTIYNIVKKSGKKDHMRRLRVDEHGRKFMSRPEGGVAFFWSPQMIDDLKRLFPCTANDDVAEYFNVSQSTIHRKARQLGLRKDPEYLRERDKLAVRSMHFKNKIHRNDGMIKPGEHRNPNGEFKKGMECEYRYRGGRKRGVRNKNRKNHDEGRILTTDC